MGVSRIELINRALPKAFRGYACRHVDRLLQDLSDSLAKATDDKVVLLSKVRDLEKTLAEYKQHESNLQEALVAARKLNENMHAQAQKEAQLVLQTARSKAVAIVHNANVRLAELQQETANLQREKAQFEMDFRSVLERHLKMLAISESAKTPASFEHKQPLGHDATQERS